MFDRYSFWPRRSRVDAQRAASKLATHLLFAAIFTCSASATAQQMFVDPVFGVNTTKNVQYGTNVVGSGANVSLRLDVYEPTQLSGGPALPGQSKAIVLMHGGFFVDGDSESSSMGIVAEEFARRGYVAVSINYRKLFDFAPAPGESLQPDPSRIPSWVPDQLVAWGVTQEQYFDTIAAATEDQAMAVNWLAANADTYNIDPNMIAAGGFSAGAVSSLLLGAGAVDGVDANVGAVFSIAGGLFGLESFFDPDDPGVFLLHGTDDTTIPFSEVSFLETALADNGIPSESLILPGVGHSSTTLLLSLAADSDPFFEFMNTQLVPEPSSVTLAGLGLLGLLPLLQRRRRRQ